MNIENMEINDTLHVRDIQIDEKYKVLSDPDEVVIHITGKVAEEIEEEIEEVEGEEVEGEEGEAAEGKEEAAAEDKEKKEEEAPKE